MSSSCGRSEPRRGCSAMRRRCRCSIPDDIAPASASSGRMPWMTGHGAVPRRRRLPTCSPAAGTEEIAGQLTGFSGILQVDGYAAYKALARGHGGAIQLAFCLAHARRKFVEVYKTTQSPFAREVIERLQAVYAIEVEIRGSSAEQRLAARRTRSAPLMAALKARLTEMVGQLFSQSKLTEAINYALNHWDGLTLFLRDGRVEVDSNTVERSMRPIAMGRRNSLFSGSEGGAESWAILSSIVNTAKLHDLDPQAYLTDVLERIVSGRTKSHQLHELLAWNWKAARQRSAQAAA